MRRTGSCLFFTSQREEVKATHGLMLDFTNQREEVKSDAQAGSQI